MATTEPDRATIERGMKQSRDAYRSLSPKGKALVDAAPCPAVLAKHLLDHLDGYGERNWDQTRWVSPCGSFACISGEAGTIAGFLYLDGHFAHTGDDWGDVGCALIGEHYLADDRSLFSADSTADEIRPVLEAIIEHDPHRVVSV